MTYILYIPFVVFAILLTITLVAVALLVLAIAVPLVIVPMACYIIIKAAWQAWCEMRFQSMTLPTKEPFDWDAILRQIQEEED